MSLGRVVLYIQGKLTLLIRGWVDFGVLAAGKAIRPMILGSCHRGGLENSLQFQRTRRQQQKQSKKEALPGSGDDLGQVRSQHGGSNWVSGEQTRGPARRRKSASPWRNRRRSERGATEPEPQAPSKPAPVNYEGPKGARGTLNAPKGPSFWSKAFTFCLSKSPWADKSRPTGGEGEPQAEADACHHWPLPSSVSIFCRMLVGSADDLVRVLFPTDPPSSDPDNGRRKTLQSASSGIEGEVRVPIAGLRVGDAWR